MLKANLISVIIPCYNAAPYIAETLESVIAQTYHHWECIIVDDHSTDNSWKIIQQYQHCYPEKIFIYKNPKKGACAARNIGMDYAKGEYLKFVDADDLLYDGSIFDIQVSYLKDAKYDITYGMEEYYNEDFSKLLRTRGHKIESYLELANNRPCNSNYLISSIKCASIRWNEMLKNGQEYVFLFECYMKGLNFHFSKDLICSKIRVHNAAHRISNNSFYEKAISGRNILYYFYEKSNTMSSIKDQSDFFKTLNHLCIIEIVKCLNYDNKEAAFEIKELLKKKYVFRNYLRWIDCLFDILLNTNPRIFLKSFNLYTFFRLGIVNKTNLFFSVIGVKVRICSYE